MARTSPGGGCSTAAMQISTRRSRAMRWPRKCGRGSTTRSTKYRASSSRRARPSSSGWRTTGRSPGRCRRRWAATSMTCSSIPPVVGAAQPTCSCGSWLASPERTAGHWSAGSRRTTTIAAAASTTSTPRAPCGSPTTCRRPPTPPRRACVLLIVEKPENSGGDEQDDVGLVHADNATLKRLLKLAKSPSMGRYGRLNSLRGRPLQTKIELNQRQSGPGVVSARRPYDDHHYGHGEGQQQEQQQQRREQREQHQPDGPQDLHGRAQSSEPGPYGREHRVAASQGGLQGGHRGPWCPAAAPCEVAKDRGDSR